MKVHLQNIYVKVENQGRGSRSRLIPA